MYACVADTPPNHQRTAFKTVSLASVSSDFISICSTPSSWEEFLPSRGEHKQRPPTWPPLAAGSRSPLAGMSSCWANGSAACPSGETCWVKFRTGKGGYAACHKVCPKGWNCETRNADGHCGSAPLPAIMYA